MRTKRKSKEESLQIAVSKYLRLQYPKVMFTSESSGIRLTMGQAVKAAKQRSGRGLPDMLILKTNSKYAGLLLELKPKSPYKVDGITLLGHGLKSGEHLREQQDNIDRLRAQGYAACFSVGFDQTKKIIDDYMRLDTGGY